MVTRHEFLTELHNLLKPETYLEVGVQYGHSLRLATHSTTVIGIDPVPLTAAQGRQQIFSMTADDYFLYHMTPGQRVDLAFIDGSHLAEDAMRDFINVEICSHPRSVVVFDDMLPLNQEMTSRIMIPGYWTGDVWKVIPFLQQHRPDLRLLLVDTEPTGTMVVLNLDNRNQTLPHLYPEILDLALSEMKVPDTILKRTEALPPSVVIYELSRWLEESELGQ